MCPEIWNPSRCKEKVMKHWHFKYKGHDIEVRNSWIKGEMLLVDGELQDERTGFGVRSVLMGRIRNGEGQGESIKASLGGWFVIGCIVFIDDREVFRA
jgi:hypothetical protein